MTYSLIPPETLIPGKLLKYKTNKTTFLFGTTFPGGYRHVCAGEVFLLVRLEGYSIELLSPDGHMGYMGWDSRCWEIIP
jgi:hypothetical protein